jgi:UDPglucose 6-dehydrogenase
VPDDPTLQPRVAVVGLWHLGTVIAACVADSDWPVLGIDPDPDNVAALNAGRPPLFEPGLADVLRDKLAAGTLRFGGPGDPGLGAAEIVWITFDTPVDADDHADVEFVLTHAEAILRDAARDALVVISSQLPVGSARGLAKRLAGSGRNDLRFASVPENLRLGRAIETFSAPDRFVAGVRTDPDREQLGRLLGRFSDRIEWMGVESAEMTKHALNAFLATSVAFINEIAGIAERVGADASEVARGLKSEQRIGPRAYLSPGDAFAGGTLARDIAFLTELANEQDVPAYVASGVAASNNAHRQWARRALLSKFSNAGDDGVTGRRIAIWGLTYKPGTDTLRRSSAVELARWLIESGASVIAYDPAIRALPSDFEPRLDLAASALDAVAGADALVVSTPWPEFRDVSAADTVAAIAAPLVLDAAGHLQGTLGEHDGVEYLRVGSPLV